MTDRTVRTAAEWASFAMSATSDEMFEALEADKAIRSKYPADQGICDADGGLYILEFVARDMPDFGIAKGDPFRRCEVCMDEREAIGHRCISDLGFRCPSPGPHKS